MSNPHILILGTQTVSDGYVTTYDLSRSCFVKFMPIARGYRMTFFFFYSVRTVSYSFEARGCKNAPANSGMGRK